MIFGTEHRETVETKDNNEDEIMRKSQITIQLELVDDQAWNGRYEKITVYADANNAFETVCAPVNLDVVMPLGGRTGNGGKRGRFIHRSAKMSKV